MVYFSYFIILLAILSCCKVYGNLATVDLTHNFGNDTVYFPSFRQWRFVLYDAGSNNQFNIFRFCALEHGGTHTDAPYHFAFGSNIHRANEVPLDRLVGKAFIVDISEKAKHNKDFLITINDLKAAENLYDTTMNDTIVLLYTGFSHHWPNLNKYLGTNTTNSSELHFPGLHPDAANWIVGSRAIKSIGIDTASVDNGQSSTFGSHRILSQQNIPIFENINLNDIEKFRTKDSMIYALPMKIEGGSGGPLRIIATYDVPGKTGLSIKSKGDNSMYYNGMFCVCKSISFVVVILVNILQNE